MKDINVSIATFIACIFIIICIGFACERKVFTLRTSYKAQIDDLRANNIELDVMLKRTKEQLKTSNEAFNALFKSTSQDSYALDVLKNQTKFIPLEVFDSTAYDLWEFDRVKYPDEVFTCTGYDLRGHIRSTAMTVAVDTSVIPLGTKLYIEFPEPYQDWNGVYTARDTGSAIKGHIIDIYVGDINAEQHKTITCNYGRRRVKVWIINEM